MRSIAYKNNLADLIRDRDAYLSQGNDYMAEKLQNLIDTTIREEVSEKMNGDFDESDDYEGVDSHGLLID